MIQFLSQIDTDLFLALNSVHAPALDGFMMLVSHKYVWVPLYAVFLTLIFRRYGWKAGALMVCAAALTIVLSDQICATYIRPYVARLRPANPDNPLSAMVHVVNGYRGGSYGFPSCHAANTFAFTAFMTLALDRRRSIWLMLLAWALLNCWSRIYLGVHYPGDLLCGALVGTICGVAVYFAVRPVAARLLDARGNTPAGANRPLFSLNIGNRGILEFGHGRLVATVEGATLLLLLSLSLL